MIKYIVCAFTPSAPIPASDQATIHIPLPISILGNGRLNITSIKAAVKFALGLIPAIYPIAEFRLSKGVISDTTIPFELSQVYGTSYLYTVSNVFFHHVFNAMPDNSEKEYYREMVVDFGENIFATLEIANPDPVSTFNDVIYIDLVIEYDEIN